MDEFTCPYCGSERPRARTCPRTQELCSWCCDRCNANACARGLTVEYYPAAERIALTIEIMPSDDIEAFQARWAEAYEKKLRRAPEPAETRAARAFLEQRLESAPPLPPSASSTTLRVPSMITGLPKGDRGK